VSRNNRKLRHRGTPGFAYVRAHEPLIMSNELDAGAAYLASLKRASPGTAAADAPAPEKVAESQAMTARAANAPHLAPGEKRKSPRYRCQGSARMQEVGSETTVWATFTDISIHGCYIEAPNPFRQGTLLSLRLEANGLKIEATGQVQVCYPGVGMGISFSRMLEEDRERLRELLRSISKPAMILNPRVTTQSLSASPDLWRAVGNPRAALQAMFTFFENRHMMGREEFVRILRDSQK
jgi:hypothetical protein